MRSAFVRLVLFATILSACVPDRTATPRAAPQTRMPLGTTLPQMPATEASILTDTPPIVATSATPTPPQEVLHDEDAEGLIVFGANMDPTSMRLHDERSGGVSWLVAARVDGQQLIPIIQSCVFQISSASHGRLAAVLGTPGKNDRCDDMLIHPERLVIVSYPDLQLQEITPLLPYFDELPDEIRTAIREGELHVVNAIHAVRLAKPAWSPDGRYLAFVAAIDGASADLYLYDSELGEIKRVSSGSNQAADPRWNPIGSGVLHQEVEYVQEQMNPIVPYPRALWWSPTGGGRLTRYADPGAAVSDWLIFAGWIDDSRFLFYYVPSSGSNASGGLMVGDVTTGRAERLLGPVERVGILAIEDHALILTSAIPEGSGFGSSSGVKALHLVDSRTMEALELPLELRGYVDLHVHARYLQFLVVNDDVGVLRILPDGTTEPLISDREIRDFSLSPSGHYAFIERDDGKNLLVAFGPDGAVDRSEDVVPNTLGSSSVWRPDGAIYFDPESGAYLRPPGPEVIHEPNRVARLAWIAWIGNPAGVLREDSPSPALDEHGGEG